ncbi:hypothetical protein O3M35_007436 [Rhynocoris fuscipes]|uniref:Reverse transcriptase domain-containing protein n=1 Tax=Rhynocoris fuscipes TaxID=488301 RepID=A0AAW1DA23_9HEMI
MLSYADDVSLFANSIVDIREKLSILKEYCDLNGLTVNTTKTKIVSSFQYLGVSFSSTGKFRQASNHFISAGRLAISKVRNILTNTLATQHSSRKKLINSIIKPVMLYSCEIWAYNYIDDLERVQLQLKRLYNLPKSTPNSFVRLEYGLTPIIVTVFKAMLSLIIKLLKLDESRIPRICYNILYNQSISTNNKNLGFINSFIDILSSINSLDIFSIQNPAILKSEKSNLIKKIINKFQSEDVQYVLNSKYNNLYRLISTYSDGELYLEMNCNIKKIRIVSQLRLSNSKFSRIYFDNSLYIFDTENICLLCSSLSPDSLLHFLFHCSTLEPLRSFHINKYFSNNYTDKDKFENLLSLSCKQQIHDI